jgi:hypothetical protein
MIILLASGVDVLFWKRGTFPFWLLGFASIVFTWLWGHRWKKQPVAEFWPDHVRLSGRWSPSLRPVYYREIVALEKLGELGLGVVYTREGTKRQSRIPIRWTSRNEELESFLEAKTGLKTQPRRSVWLWLARAPGSALPTMDEPGAWVGHVVLLLGGIPAGIVAVLVAALSYFGLRALGKEVPLWFIFVLAVGSWIATYGLLVRWRFKKRKSRR